MAASGALLISLDFELYWGLWDKLTLEECRDQLLATRQVIPVLLSLFADFEVHVTWAAVGFLFFPTREALLAALPAERPQYTDFSVCAYRHLPAVGEDEARDPFHFAPSLLQLIRRHPHQEIATHTFSHYYSLEPGQNLAAFRADLQAALAAARQQGIALESLVFPRNQVCWPYLEVLPELGIRSYRGETPAWYHFYRDRATSPPVTHALRFADAFLPLARPYCYRTEEAGPAAPYDLRASRFLRPYTPRLRALEPLRLRRVANEMTAAARQGRVYHLWCHPENFGAHTEENLAGLRFLLEHFARLRARWGMESSTMGELARRLGSQSAPSDRAAARLTP